MKLLEKSQLIKNQEIKARDNLETFCQTIKKVNPEINAFLEINKEQALKRARVIDSKIERGEKVGRLAGLVIGIKSNINVEDFHITAASRTL